MLMRFPGPAARLLSPVAVAAVFFIIISAPPARAATINVPCTTGDLIAAIGTANNEGTNPGPDTLELAPACIYVLTTAYGGTANGLPAITTDITIHGNGASIARDPSAPHFRIFRVDGGGVLTLDQLSVSGGHWHTVARVTKPCQLHYHVQSGRERLLQ